MIKVIIQVEGGIVVAVHSTHEMQYIVVDKDVQSDERVIVGEVNEPDSVIGENGLFSKKVFKLKSTDKDEVEIHTELVFKGF